MIHTHLQLHVAPIRRKRQTLKILQKVMFLFFGKRVAFDRKVLPLLTEDHVDVKAITFTRVTWKTVMFGNQIKPW